MIGRGTKKSMGVWFSVWLAAVVGWARVTDLRAQPAEPPSGPTPPKDSAGAPKLTLPRPISAEVEYPDTAKGNAQVILELVVTQEGRVTNATVVSGREPFSSAARSAALGWRFEPGRREDRPVAARIRFSVQFVEQKPTAETDQAAPHASLDEGKVSSAAPKPELKAAPPLEVVVHGGRPPPASSRMTRAEVDQLPGALGDPFRAVEAMPGVTPAISGLPYFYVRGAPPGNVGYLVDGIRVPLIFHAFLGPSVLHPATLKSVDLYRGAYPARFGRYAGGIVAAEVQPLGERFGGEASVRLYDAGALVYGPFANGRGKVAAAGRYSYTGYIISLLSDVTLGYWDYQVQASYDVGPSDTVSLLTFGAYDFLSAETLETDRQEDLEEAVERSEDAGTAVEFHRVSLRYDHHLAAEGRVRLAATVGEDQLIGVLGSMRERMAGLRTDLDHTISGSVRLQAGSDMEVHRYQLELDTQILNYYEYLELFPSRDDVVWGGWIGVELRPEPWLTVTPALRSDLFRSEDRETLAVDPRLSASFDITGEIRMDHAVGMAHQPPGFVPGLPTAQVARLRGGLQRSVQASSGVEVELPEDMVGSFTVFEHVYLNLSDPLGVSRQFSTDPDLANRRALGATHGIEVFVRRPLTRRVGGFLGYTLSRSTRSYRSISTLAAFDRPHVIQAAAAVDLGRRWRAGTRLMLMSGVPTQTDTPEGPLFGGERAPAFFRADLRVEKRWILSEQVSLAAVAEVLNATLAQEVTGRKCTATCTESRVGPITIPSVGVEAAF